MVVNEDLGEHFQNIEEWTPRRFRNSFESASRTAGRTSESLEFRMDAVSNDQGF
jgi:hypothetical protein